MKFLRSFLLAIVGLTVGSQGVVERLGGFVGGALSLGFEAGFGGLKTLVIDFALKEMKWDEFGDILFDGFGEVGEFFTDDFAKFFAKDLNGFMTGEVLEFGEEIGDFFEGDFKDFFVDDVKEFFADDMADFFTEDVAEFFTDDLAEFFAEDVSEFFSEDVKDFFEDDVGKVFTDVIPKAFHIKAVFFRAIWTSFTRAMESAAETMFDGIIEAYEWTSDALKLTGCIVVGLFEDCTECVEDACNDGLSEVAPNQPNGSKLKNVEVLGLAINVAKMAMNGKIQTIIDGCASALEGCPSVLACDYLANGPAEVRNELAAGTIAKCNMCYQCLPFGATTEGCQEVLDATMPNTCEECDEAQEQMYQGFLTCAGMESMVKAVSLTAEKLSKKSGRKPINELCDTCRDCSASKFEKKLDGICKTWGKIKADWDFKAPVVPEILIPPTPKKGGGKKKNGKAKDSNSSSEDFVCEVDRPAAVVTKGKKAGKAITNVPDECACAEECDRRSNAKAWSYLVKTRQCKCFKSVKQAKCLAFPRNGAAGFLASNVPGKALVPTKDEC